MITKATRRDMMQQAYTRNIDSSRTKASRHVLELCLENFLFYNICSLSPCFPGSQESEGNRENTTSKTDKKENSKPLSAVVKNALGDPRASKAIKLAVHPELIKSFKIYMTEGLPRVETDELLSKYAVTEGLEAPILNEPIAAKLNEKSMKKDAYRLEAQKSASIALSVISSIITMVNYADEK